MHILLSICLLTSPGTCREEKIDWSLDGAGAMACMVRAQELIAQWHLAHPRWKVAGWRCTPRQSLSNDI